MMDYEYFEELADLEIAAGGALAASPQAIATLEKISSRVDRGQFKETKHPRDSRGRFATKAGTRTAKPVSNKPRPSGTELGKVAEKKNKTANAIASEIDTVKFSAQGDEKKKRVTSWYGKINRADPEFKNTIPRRTSIDQKLVLIKDWVDANKGKRETEEITTKNKTKTKTTKAKTESTKTKTSKKAIELTDDELRKKTIKELEGIAKELGADEPVKYKNRKSSWVEAIARKRDGATQQKITVKGGLENLRDDFASLTQGNTSRQAQLDAAQAKMREANKKIYDIVESGKNPTVKDYAERRLAEAEWNRLYSQLNKEKQELLIKSLSDAKNRSEVISIQAHNMSKNESMWSFEFEGIKYFTTGDVDGKNPAVGTIRELLERPKLPESLTKHTDQVIFSEQRSNADEYWSKKYKIEGFVSGATGGDGRVVYYNKNGGADTLAHEMGHNFAYGRYGTTNPPDSSKYVKAAKKDGKHLSDYGQKAIAEDFAESVAFYFSNNWYRGIENPRKEMQEKMPNRFAVIKELLENERSRG